MVTFSTVDWEATKREVARSLIGAERDVAARGNLLLKRLAYVQQTCALLAKAPRHKREAAAAAAQLAIDNVAEHLILARR